MSILWGEGTKLMQAALLKVMIFAVKVEAVRTCEVSPVWLTSTWCYPLKTQSALPLKHTLSVFLVSLQ
jgi:hypothetical protein